MYNNDLTRKDDLVVKVKSFIKNAQDFCLLVEESDETSYDNFLRKLSCSLAGLYLIASSLPDVEPDDGSETPDYSNEKNITEKTRSIKSGLDKKLQEHNKYYEVFDPRFLEKEDPIETTLSDDIVDIYTDVKVILENHYRQADNNIYNSIWDWKFGFQNHWGNHLVDALRVIHRLLYA